MSTLRQALFDSVSSADVKEIADGLVKRAKEGDLKATDMLFRYLIGQPGSVKISRRIDEIECSGY